MSSFIRRIQRSVKRAATRTCSAPHYMGRGSKLGTRNPKDKAKLAREKREARNRARKGGKV